MRADIERWDRKYAEPGIEPGGEPDPLLHAYRHLLLLECRYILNKVQDRPGQHNERPSHCRKRARALRHRFLHKLPTHLDEFDSIRKYYCTCTNQC